MYGKKEDKRQYYYNGEDLYNDHQVHDDLQFFKYEEIRDAFDGEGGSDKTKNEEQLKYGVAGSSQQPQSKATEGVTSINDMGLESSESDQSSIDQVQLKHKSGKNVQVSGSSMERSALLTVPLVVSNIRELNTQSRTKIGQMLELAEKKFHRQLFFWAHDYIWAMSQEQERNVSRAWLDFIVRNRSMPVMYDYLRLFFFSLHLPYRVHPFDQEPALTYLGEERFNLFAAGRMMLVRLRLQLLKMHNHISYAQEVERRDKEFSLSSKTIFGGTRNVVEWLPTIQVGVNLFKGRKEYFATQKLPSVGRHFWFTFMRSGLPYSFIDLGEHLNEKDIAGRIADHLWYLERTKQRPLNDSDIISLRIKSKNWWLCEFRAKLSDKFKYKDQRPVNEFLWAIPLSLIERKCKWDRNPYGHLNRKDLPRLNLLKGLNKGLLPHLLSNGGSISTNELDESFNEDQRTSIPVERPVTGETALQSVFEEFSIDHKKSDPRRFSLLCNEDTVSCSSVSSLGQLVENQTEIPSSVSQVAGSRNSSLGFGAATELSFIDRFLLPTADIVFDEEAQDVVDPFGGWNQPDEAWVAPPEIVLPREQFLLPVAGLENRRAGQLFRPAMGQRRSSSAVKVLGPIVWPDTDHLYDINTDFVRSDNPFEFLDSDQARNISDLASVCTEISEEEGGWLDLASVADQIGKNDV